MTDDEEGWEWFRSLPRPRNKHRWRIPVLVTGESRSVREAAQEAGVPYERVRRLAASGKVDAERDSGGRWMVDMGSLARWLGSRGRE